MSAVRHDRVGAAGVTLHVARAGDGPLVLLLHGFPEILVLLAAPDPALAYAGFRVVAPDLRGYNLSDKPPGVASYRARLLVADVAGLIATPGRARPPCVGHDWGGVIAWKVAKPARRRRAPRDPQRPAPRRVP